MDRGKREMEPEPNEEERRQTRLRRTAVMAAKQIFALSSFSLICFIVFIYAYFSLVQLCDWSTFPVWGNAPHENGYGEILVPVGFADLGMG
jgi:hypothetical protein